MQFNAPIADDIRATDQKAQYDASCKRLLSEKIFLAWIMKSCLKEYENCKVEEIAEKYIEGEPEISAVPVAPDETNKIRGLDTEDKTLTEGTVTYDIRFMATLPNSAGLIQMIINVEAQNNFYPGYPLVMRAIYYCCRLISSQQGTEFTHSEYQKIKKVASIFICLNPPKERRNTITRYYITEENLVGSVRETLSHYDLLTATILCIGGGEDSTGVFRLLDTLLSADAPVEERCRILQDEFDIPMTETLETEVETMCNLSQGVEERGRLRGRTEGRAEGRAQGRAEGRAEGRTEGILSSIRTLMDTMGWTMEQAMSALNISDEDRPKYAKLLTH